MRFGFVDRIIELTRGKHIVAVKAVSLAEEYLADHFPTFPVLPGVLMLETLTEAAAWLIRDAQDFSSSLILLREARNVTYKSFVRPGRILRAEVHCRRLEPQESEFEGMGYCDDAEVVRARFGMTHGLVSQSGPNGEKTDRIMIEAARARFAVLYPAAFRKGG